MAHPRVFRDYTIYIQVQKPSFVAGKLGANVENLENFLGVTVTNGKTSPLCCP